MSGEERYGPPAAGGQPGLSRFKTALHTPFTVRLDDARSVALTLDEITSAPDVRPGWESFSLTFRGPSPPVFWDGTFDVEHAALGPFPMYLVAVQTEGDGQYYEAVFFRRTT
jgi:hypothetical protein